MEEYDSLLAVTQRSAVQFFYDHLLDLAPDASKNEKLYNASVLAHSASTSVCSTEHFPSTIPNLKVFFDRFVLDRSEHHDPELFEAAGAQCLVLTGFFARQMRHNHNLEWYASLGKGFFKRSADYGTDPARVRMMTVMASEFGYWQQKYRILSRKIRESPYLLH